MHGNDELIDAMVLRERCRGSDQGLPRATPAVSVSNDDMVDLDRGNVEQQPGAGHREQRHAQCLTGSLRCAVEGQDQVPLRVFERVGIAGYQLRPARNSVAPTSRARLNREHLVTELIAELKQGR